MTKTDAKHSQTITQNELNQFVVNHKALPLHCPLPGASLWNAHPRVFLSFEGKTQANCPYCGAEYILSKE